MKDAIDATTHDLGEWKNKAEMLKSGKAEREAAKKKNAAERDKVFQLVTTLKARDLEFEKAVIDAQHPEQAQLARERQINYQWQVKVESLRLQVIEAEIALEAKLADVHELDAKVCYAHIRLAEKELEEMRERFSAESKKQESDLAKAAADENSKAQSVRHAPTRALPGTTDRRASRARGTGPQVRASAGHQPFPLVRGAAKTWPTAPIKISFGSSSFSRMAASAGSTPSSSITSFA